jgi:DNA-binding Lrp family transcriptional regulator
MGKVILSIAGKKMSIKILSFIKVELGHTLEIVEKLKGFKNIKEIYYIKVEYDLVVKIEGDSSEELQKFMVERIGMIKWLKKINSHLMVKRWATDFEG